MHMEAIALLTSRMQRSRFSFDAWKRLRKICQSEISVYMRIGGATSASSDMEVLLIVFAMKCTARVASWWLEIVNVLIHKS